MKINFINPIGQQITYYWQRHFKISCYLLACAFLLAAKIDPPHRVYGHGWILSGEEKNV